MAPTDQIMSSSATPSEKEIRILIADDHPIVREGLIAVFALEDDLKVVGHAHDGDRQLVGSVTFRFTEDQEFLRKSSPQEVQSTDWPTWA
jgi:hypothetical protein